MFHFSRRNDGSVERNASLVIVVASAGAVAATAFLLWKNAGRNSIEREDSSKGPKDFVVAARTRIQNKVSGTKKRQNGRSHPNASGGKAAHLERAKFKEERRQSKLKDLSMKKPMYDNVIMLDPHGEILCTISKKKARWYIAKGLAEWDNVQEHSSDESRKSTNSEQNLKIRINFEPKNRSNRGETGLYVRTAKQNKCVVCGSAEHLMRHYVVPYAYRSLLPQHYKTHLSHDIVILCPNCHLHCEQHRQKRMTDMEDACRTAYLKTRSIPPLGTTDNSDEVNYHLPLLTDPDLYHVRSCALALLNWKHNLPEEKRIDYENVVRDFFISRCPENDVESEPRPSDSKDEESHNLAAPSGPDLELSKELLQKAIDVDYKIPNENYISGADLIVDGLGTDDNLIADFIRDWRRHFLAVAQPRHMPVGWSVNSSVVCGED